MSAQAAAAFGSIAESWRSSSSAPATSSESDLVTETMIRRAAMVHAVAANEAGSTSSIDVQSATAGARGYFFGDAGPFGFFCDGVGFATAASGFGAAFVAFGFGSLPRS